MVKQSGFPSGFRIIGVWFGLFSIFLGLIALILVPGPKVQASTNLTVTQGAGGTGTNAWANPANANGTTDDNVYATAVEAKGGSSSGDWGTYGFDSTIPSNATITKVEIMPQYHVDTTAFVATLEVQAVVGGTACPTTPSIDGSEPTTDTIYTADITSCQSWTRTNLLDANFKTRIVAKRSNAGTAGNVTFSLDYVKVRVTYDTPDYVQASYRIFKNANSTNVGVALAALNTPATTTYPSSPLRLRLLIRLATANLASGLGSYKLQFVGKGSGTCAAPSAGTPAAYTDVTTSTAISFADNSPANGATLTTNASDPTDGTNTIKSQTYVEANNFSNSVSAINVGEDGLWDFALKDNGAPASTTYCFRAVESGGTVFSSYLNYPQLTTSAAGSLSSDIVNASGVTVASPVFALSSTSKPFDCITTTGVFGTSSQRMRISNSLTALGWTVSIAATNGNTALWSAGTPKYDFNDPSGSPAGCSAGLDSDSYAGQLSINPSASTIAAQSGCASTGVNAGSAAAFNEGTTDSVTLMTGSSSSELGCYWELTGVGLSQKIPALQPEGSYSLNLTITVVSN